MNAPSHIADRLLQRHRAGRCLFTLDLHPDEVSVLRADLTSAVRLRGLTALHAPAYARAFVVYAAEYLVQQGHALEWRPILGSIGVPPEETGRYPELYEPIKDALGAFRAVGRSAP